MEVSQPRAARGTAASRLGWALLLFSASGASEVLLPTLFQPQPFVGSGQGNPQIWCVVQGSPARAHVLSWYQHRKGNGPTFLLSQRDGAPPSYGSGVNPRFLAELDPIQNGARLTIGNASPHDEGTYYCAMWFSGQYIFGEGTRLLYQPEIQPSVLRPPELSLFLSASGPPFSVLCVALGHQPAPVRISWAVRGQHLSQEDDITGEPREPMVSWLQLSQEMAGMTVTCRGLHQSGVSEVELTLPLPQGQVNLEQTLITSIYCYLGLLGAALLCDLILALLWINRSWVHHPSPLTQDASMMQAASKHTTARAVRYGRRRPNNFQIRKTAS